MARRSSLTLETIISELSRRRAMYAEGLAQIDALLAAHDIVPPTEQTGHARQAKSSDGRVGKKRRKRGKFKQNAEELILGLLTQKPMTTAELNAAWTSAGRKGSADNALSLLTKTRKLKRVRNKQNRGSTYTAL